MMDIMSRARLRELDPETGNALRKTARDYFENRCKESVPDAVEDAFTMLTELISARQQRQEVDEWLHEIFYGGTGAI